MLGAICGDIIGSPYEFGGVKDEDFELFVEDSRLTDDSYMTLAIADALMALSPEHRYDWDALSGQCSLRMRKFGLAHPKAGYGGMFVKWLEGVLADGLGSWGNGSAMRVSPVAWFYDEPDDVLAAAEATALPTHSSPEGIRGAKAIAAATFFARIGENKFFIADYIEKTFYYDLRRSIDEIRPEYSFDVSCAGSVPVAIRAFLDSDSYEDAIRKAVSVGGDSDTIGAMAGAIAEAFYGGVPEHIAAVGRQKISEDEMASDVFGRWNALIAQRAD